MIKTLRNRKYPNAEKLYLLDEKGIKSIAKFCVDEFANRLGIKKG